MLIQKFWLKYIIFLRSVIANITHQIYKNIITFKLFWKSLTRTELTKKDLKLYSQGCFYLRSLSFIQRLFGLKRGLIVLRAVKLYKILLIWIIFFSLEKWMAPSLSGYSSTRGVFGPHLLVFQLRVWGCYLSIKSFIVNITMKYLV